MLRLQPTPFVETKCWPNVFNSLLPAVLVCRASADMVQRHIEFIASRSSCVSCCAASCLCRFARPPLSGHLVADRRVQRRVDTSVLVRISIDRPAGMNESILHFPRIYNSLW